MGRGRDGEEALLGPVTPVGPIGAASAASIVGAGRVSDVGAVLGALELDALDGLVDAFPRRLDGWPQGDDGQDPTMGRAFALTQKGMQPVRAFHPHGQTLDKFSCASAACRLQVQRS